MQKEKDSKADDIARNKEENDDKSKDNIDILPKTGNNETRQIKINNVGNKTAEIDQKQNENLKKTESKTEMKTEITESNDASLKTGGGTIRGRRRGRGRGRGIPSNNNDGDDISYEKSMKQFKQNENIGNHDIDNDSINSLSIQRQNYFISKAKHFRSNINNELMKRYRKIQSNFDKKKQILKLEVINILFIC